MTGLYPIKQYQVSNRQLTQKHLRKDKQQLSRDVLMRVGTIDKKLVCNLRLFGVDRC